MMVGYKKFGAVLGAIAVGLLAVAPAAVDAQVPGPDREGFIRYSPIFWSFDARGGVAIPAGDLSEVADAGPTIGAGFAYFLNPRFALRLDGNVDLMKGKDEGGADAPDLRAWNYTGGVEIHVTEPSERGLSFLFDLGAGGVTFDSDRFAGELGTGQQFTNARFRNTYFALKGGARLGVNVSEVANLFLSGGVRLLFASEDGSQLLAAFYGVEPFSTVFTIPVEGGLRINIP